MKRIVLIVIYLSISFNIFSQNLTFFGTYPAYSQSGSITKKLGYNLFVSSTMTNKSETIEKKLYPATNLQMFYQPSLNYKLNAKNILGVGYVYVSHNIFGTKENENRIWIQDLRVDNLGKGKLSNRLRFETRYPHNLQTDIWSSCYSIRYQIGYNYPLYDTQSRKDGFYLMANNETFICLLGAKNGPVSAKNSTVGEDWVAAGIGYSTGKKSRFELGYMLQVLDRNKNHDLRRLNLIQMTWHVNLNWDDLQYWYYSSI